MEVAETRCQMIDELQPLCDRAGLGLRRSTDKHYQITHGGVAVVDVWPTRNKYRRVSANADAKAMVGRANDAFQLAVNCAAGKHPKPCAPNRASPDKTLRDEFAIASIEVIADRMYSTDRNWTPEMLAKTAYEIADAMMQERLLPKENANGDDNN